LKLNCSILILCFYDKNMFVWAKRICFYENLKYLFVPLPSSLHKYPLFSSWPVSHHGLTLPIHFFFYVFFSVLSFSITIIMSNKFYCFLKKKCQYSKTFRIHFKIFTTFFHCSGITFHKPIFGNNTFMKYVKKVDLGGNSGKTCKK